MGSPWQSPTRCPCRRSQQDFCRTPNGTSGRIMGHGSAICGDGSENAMRLEPWRQPLRKMMLGSLDLWMSDVGRKNGRRSEVLLNMMVTFQGSLNKIRCISINVYFFLFFFLPYDMFLSPEVREFFSNFGTVTLVPWNMQTTNVLVVLLWQMYRFWCNDTPRMIPFFMSPSNIWLKSWLIELFLY